MSPGDPDQKAEFIIFPGTTVQVEHLGPWLEQRVAKGDVQWVTMCVYGAKGPYMVNAGGVTNAILAWVAAVWLQYAAGPGMVPNSLEDYEEENGNGPEEG